MVPICMSSKAATGATWHMTWLCANGGMADNPLAWMRQALAFHAGAEAKYQAWRGRTGLTEQRKWWNSMVLTMGVDLCHIISVVD